MNPSLKNINHIYTAGSKHWVGDGFQVRNYFPSHDLDKQLSPFLLLDYAGPTEFPAGPQHGVGEHPHRGFETVTIVYQGKIAHRDSAGNHGVIGVGDVQWMTAASGVVHEEMHEKSFAEKGGMVEMIQLWVNLPRKQKMSTPRYQTLSKQQIPVVTLTDKKCYVRVIAGEFAGHKGVAKTVTPINLYDVFLAAENSCQFNLPENYSTAIFLLKGEISVNDSQTISDTHLIVFEKSGEIINLSAKKDSQLLILNGQSIEEPIARSGPFVMNTQDELVEAINDYRSGKMGHLN